MVFIILVPFLGVFVDLIAQHDGMRDLTLAQAKSQREAMDQYVRETAAGPASEMTKAKELLDSGAITQDDFDKLKAQGPVRLTRTAGGAEESCCAR